MPLPFLVPGAIAAASLLLAGTGVATSVAASKKNKKAKSLNEDAQRIYKRAERKADGARRRSNDSLEKLGKTKLRVLDKTMGRFIRNFEQIKNIQMRGSSGLDEMNRVLLDEKAVVEMRELSQMAGSVLGGIAGGAGAGALAAFGAYGATMTFATASTGTAIASLSGVAASNATLAFLGGGALAAGGGGMALGSAVLGGAVAGPAIAILGLVMNASASKNLDNAYSNHAEAEKIAESLKVIHTLCNAIADRADLFVALLNKLAEVMDELNNRLEDVLVNSGTSYSDYDEEEQSVVSMALSTAKAIKQVLDTPVLDKDGKLTEESKLLLEEKGTYVGDVCAMLDTDELAKADDEDTDDNENGNLVADQFCTSIAGSINILNRKNVDTSGFVLKVISVSKISERNYKVTVMIKQSAVKVGDICRTEKGERYGITKMHAGRMEINKAQEGSIVTMHLLAEHDIDPSGQMLYKMSK